MLGTSENIVDGTEVGAPLGILLGINDGTLLSSRLGLELGRGDKGTVGTGEVTSLGILLGTSLGEVEGASQPGKDIEPSTFEPATINASSISVTVGS